MKTLTQSQMRLLRIACQEAEAWRQYIPPSQYHQFDADTDVVRAALRLIEDQQEFVAQCGKDAQPVVHQKSPCTAPLSVKGPGGARVAAFKLEYGGHGHAPSMVDLYEAEFMCFGQETELTNEGPKTHMVAVLKLDDGLVATHMACHVRFL